ncbi:MAG: FCD domain-containing protein [Thermodesulfobacteriota bacterium]
MELSPSEIDDLFEAREVIETQFFIRSAENISKDLVLKFKENLSRQETEMREREGDSNGWNESRKKYLKTDRALHDVLVSAAGNAYWGSSLLESEGSD